MKTFVLLSLLLIPVATVHAEMTRSEPAQCTRSANLLACQDRDGNVYSVHSQGNTQYVRGVEVLGRALQGQPVDTLRGKPKGSSHTEQGKDLLSNKQRPARTRLVNAPSTQADV